MITAIINPDFLGLLNVAENMERTIAWNIPSVLFSTAEAEIYRAISWPNLLRSGIYAACDILQSFAYYTRRSESMSRVQ